MRSTNPREVGLIFREYARKIHAKSVPTDPSFIRISVACGKVKYHLLELKLEFSLNNHRLNNGANIITPPLFKSPARALEAELKLLTPLILAHVSSCMNIPVNSSSLLRKTLRTGSQMGMRAGTRRYRRRRAN